MATWAIAAYVANEVTKEIIATLSATSDPPDAGFVQRKAAPLTILAMTTGGLFLVFGPGFLFCFVHWLLAIRRRRTAEAAVFAPPGM